MVVNVCPPGGLVAGYWVGPTWTVGVLMLLVAGVVARVAPGAGVHWTVGSQHVPPSPPPLIQMGSLVSSLVSC